MQDKGVVKEYLMQLLLHKNSIIKVSVVFFIGGLIMAIFSPNEFVSQNRVLPEANSSSLSSLGSLGALGNLAGINLSNIDSEGTTIPPNLYSSILSSQPFLIDIMESRHYFETEQDTLSIYDFFMNAEKLAPPALLFSSVMNIKSWIKNLITSESIPEKYNEAFIQLTNEEEKIIEKIRERIRIEVSDETGVVTVSVKMQDPKVAARLAEFTFEYLKKYITDYKTRKQYENLSFLSGQLSTAKSNYEKSQRILAEYVEKNAFVVSKNQQLEQARLEAEFNLAFEVYKSLLQQKEQAKIELNRNTPIFSVLDPTNIPSDKNSPNRILIILLYSISGFCLVTAYYLFKIIDWE